jgi:hypothetical protein
VPGDLTRTGLELWWNAGAVLGELATDGADVRRVQRDRVREGGIPRWQYRLRGRADDSGDHDRGAGCAAIVSGFHAFIAWPPSSDRPLAPEAS